MTAHLLESSLARFKNVACCFQTISCLLNFQRGKEIDLLSPLFIFSSMKENKKFTNVFTQNISELATLQVVMS